MDKIDAFYSGGLKSGQRRPILKVLPDFSNIRSRPHNTNSHVQVWTMRAARPSIRLCGVRLARIARGDLSFCTFAAKDLLKTMDALLARRAGTRQ